MNIFRYSFLLGASLLAFPFFVKTQEASEELAQEEKKQTDLTNQIDKNTQEQQKLLDEYNQAQNRKNTQEAEKYHNELTDLEQKKAALEEELSKVKSRVAFIEKESGTTIPIVPKVPKKEPLPPSEQNAAEIKEWQTDWSKTTTNPWVRTFGSSDVFDPTLTPDVRVQKLTPVIKNFPVDLFRDNTADGLNALIAISKVLNDLDTQNLINTETVDYKSLLATLEAHYKELISSGDFKQTTASTGTFSSLTADANQPIEQTILGLSQALSTLNKATGPGTAFAEQLIVTEISQEIKQAPDASLDKIKDYLSSSLLADNTSAQNALEKVLVSRQIDLFKRNVSKASLSSPTLADDAKKLLSSVPAASKKLAEVAIIDQFNKLSAQLDKSLDANIDDSTSAAKKLSKTYKSLSESGLDALSQSQLDTSMAKSITDIIEKANKGKTLNESATTFVNLAEIISDAKIDLKTSPKIYAAIAQPFQEIITNELSKHTLVDEAATLNSKDAYSDAYENELKLLNTYIPFAEKYDPSFSSTEPQSLKISMYKRLTRLNDYVAGQEEAQASYVGKIAKRSFSTITTSLTDALNLFKGTDSIATTLEKAAAVFTKDEAVQKELFSKYIIPALPEDMLALLTTQINEVKTKLDTAKGAEYTELFKQLEALDKKLSAPLFTDGNTTYTLGSLLIEKSDKDAYAALSKEIAPYLISSFTKKVDELKSTKSDLGSASPKRTTELNELNEMRNRLLTDPAFSSAEGASELLTSLNALIKTAKDADQKEQTTLVAATKKAADDAQKASIDELIGQKKTLTDLTTKLENLIANASGPVSDTVLTQALQEARSWASMSDIATSYKVLAEAGSSAEAIQTAYVTLLNNYPVILEAYDYRSETVNYGNRLLEMGRQQKALEKVVELFSEFKTGKSVNLVDMGNALMDIIEESKEPDANTLAALKELGYVNADGVITEKGLALTDFYRQQVDIYTRSSQLEEFQAKSKTKPSLEMMFGKKPIKLAETLKLNWLIPQDQMDALKDAHNQSTRDAMKLRILDVQGAVLKRIETIEEGLANIGKLLALKPQEAQDPAVLAKKLGWEEADVESGASFAKKLGLKNALDVEGVAQAFGITLTDPTQAKINAVLAELGLPSGTPLTLESEAVRIKLLQVMAVTKELQSQVTKRTGASGTVTTSNTALLGDIADILTVLRSRAQEEVKNQSKQAGKPQLTVQDFVDTKFSAFIDVERMTSTMSEEERAKFDLSQRVLSILAAQDGGNALQFEPLTFKQQFKSMFTEMNYLVGDGVNAFGVQTSSFLLKGQSGIASLLKIASLPVAAVSWFFTRTAINSAADAARLGATGAATATLGPLGGLAAYFMVPSPGFLADAVGIFAGTAAGGALYWIGKSAEPTAAQIEELNQKLLQEGYDPIALTKEKGWAQAAAEWTQKLYQSYMTTALKNLAQQKEVLTTKNEFAQRAKKEYLELLDLPENASASEIESALTSLQARLETSWGVNRYLVKRRYDNAYRFMLRAQQDVVSANLTYVTALNALQTGVLSRPAAESQTTALGWGWAKIKGTFGDAWRKMTGQPQAEGSMTLSANEFSKFQNQTEEFYGRQAADLNAMKDIFEKNKAEIKAASPFTDDTYFNTFTSAIDSRVNVLRDEYEQGVKALLQEHGIKETGPKK